MANEEWWRGAVIYQVYPRSFIDTSGDGVGDLAGITQNLDYVASLGVDGFWVSPFFPSPMKDFGYDVADYCNVDPLFGTLDDFDALVARAHDLGLKVIIDQVYSHTSDRHAWFEESRQSRENPRADWYVWADAQPDGSPPNNWQSIMGIPAWTWDARRQQYYLHNYLAEQPDLNLHNAEVQDALLDVARFWLERGVDGFRLDAIHCGMHDPQLRDNPPALGEARGETRPYYMQTQQYNMCHDDLPTVLERLREVLDTYDDILTVAEVGSPDPLPLMKDYTQGSRRLHTAYGFDFLSAATLDKALVKDTLSGWPGESGEGWPSWAFSNHDAPRVASRWCQDLEHGRRVRLIALLQVALRGNMFLYQGEELGLTQALIPFEKLQDPEGINNWPHGLGRDGARTPMPWQSAAAFAGFSRQEPWLPIAEDHLALAVDAQERDPDSILNLFRELIGLRRRHPALRCGDLDFLEAPENVLAFTRTYEGETLHCVFNLGGSAASWNPGDVVFHASAGLGDKQRVSGLPSWSGYIGALADD
ncbi:MAG: alpha glucosidase [Woeseiaceae bacterium]|nr:alpha glucosidase [Woeseiaceae bacterium]